METIKSLKVRFKNIENNLLHAETFDGEPVVLLCNDNQQQELNNLNRCLQPGSIFNLLNAVQTVSGHWAVEFLILEPDYLIDISSLAECFRPYGRHPLNYMLSRVRPVDNTQYILLGNTANFFIDELINEHPDRPVDYLTILKKCFQSSPFEFSACEDLKDSTAESNFFASCRKHFIHIRETIYKLFPKAGIDREKAILEPSFISNALGIQGRLDVMLYNYSSFVELKSGKGTEDYRTGGQFIHSAINHYTQMILYLAVLEFNLNLNPDDIRSYLLYSKYPVLSKERHSRKQLQEAIALRNEIVALEYDIQRHNSIGFTEHILNDIRPEILNTARLTGNFYEHYLRPSIGVFQASLDSLNERERAYFMRLYTFITKELWLSKAGEKAYEGISRASNLWNASFEDKMIAGEILYDLRIKENLSATDVHTVALEIPEYKELYLPNFRTGDAVVLYERISEADTVNNRQVFKGSIELLDGNRIVVRLRYRQRNAAIWNEQSLYALEHDYMDTTYSGMFRALSAFAEANRDRRDLLLCRRKPEVNLTADAYTNEDDDVARSVGKAMASKDCFLLVGPPGTGKTSLALKQIVEACLRENKSNILLLSYTNRAVDEICKALISISDQLPFIRIGSELNCHSEYRNRLLDHCLEACTRRSEVQTVINRCRIFVGTVASVWNKPELFTLKRFDMAIIDEATQLLEPHLLGILCARTKEGRNAVDRFVLIGDYKQLPAVILQSPEESKVTDPVLNEIGLFDWSNSLFERLYRNYKEENIGYAFDLLSKQGRMHPAIAAFPSAHFYENKLDCAGLPHQNEPWDSSVRLAFFPAKKTADDRSDKSNREEAAIVVRICEKLVERSRSDGTSFDPHSIGIITPYRNQIALIRKLLQETGIDALSSIAVDTIERFQGSQRDVIIYSFCVNAPWQLDALPCLMEENGKMIDRKLNVVLTRARKQLFITGNPELLSKNRLYNSLLEHIQSLH